MLLTLALAIGANTAVFSVVNGVLINPLTGIATAIGLGAAAGLTRVMTSLLFDVSPVDPLTYIVVALLLMTATLIASYIPARRISRVDPAVAMRAD